MISLGILIAIVYFIGKKFFELAHEYRKNCWLYAVLGAASYFLISFILGIILGIIMVATNNQMYLIENGVVIEFLAIPIVLAGVWLFYILLEKNWKKAKQKDITNSEILDV